MPHFCDRGFTGSEIMRIVFFALFFSLFGSLSSFSSEALGSGNEARVVIISDLNGSYGSTTYGSDVKAAIRRLVELRPDLVLATGDLVAGQKAGLDYRAMWKGFHAVVTEPLEKAGIPLAVTAGNHDGSAYPRYALERKIFGEEWITHKPKLQFHEGGQYPYFYAFVFNQVLYLSIDSTRVGPLPHDQLSWLEKELKAKPDTMRAVVFTHVPLFHFANVPEGESFFDEALADLLDRFGVNLYLTGHHHSFYPGFHHRTHFVSQACLGSGPTFLNGREQRSEKAFTVIDFKENGFEIKALKAPLYLEPIDPKTLPSSITSKGKTLLLKDQSP